MVNDLKKALEVILYEGRGADPLDPKVRFGMMQQLLDRGYQVRRVRSGQRPASPPETGADSLLVLGRFGGATPDLEDADGIRSLAVRDVDGLGANEIVELVEGVRGDRSLNQPPDMAGEGSRSWKPWFPVIDYDRCTNCMQCLSFCLFDVYGVDGEQRIQVQNQDNCKTNCPACSRVCPEVAIMFPKYGSGPINGAPVSDQDVNREKMKVDISALLGGDIYSSLRERSAAAKTRFSKERSPDKALNERKKCLTKLQGDGIIPPEVLAEIDMESLPSQEEILQRAKSAAERADAARKAAGDSAPAPPES